MRREARPAGDGIEFDEFDRTRWPALPEWAPMGEIPRIFEEITIGLEGSNIELPKERWTDEEADICIRSLMLRQTLEEMLDVAGDEIVTAYFAVAV